MRTTELNRQTHIEVYGMPREEWFNWKSMAKGGLQSMHMGWSFTSGACTTLEEILQRIKERKDLEMVYFYYAGKDREQMSKEAVTIADAICEHPHKPWVYLDWQLTYLTPIFEAKGIKIWQGLIFYGLHARWASQLLDDEAA